MKLLRLSLVALPLLACLALLWPRSQNPIRIGSKSFTESVILGEMLTQLTRDAGVQSMHRAQLGGTRVLWNALLSGDIDMYPEYTGTIAREILSHLGLETETEVRDAVEAEGLRMSEPIGFNNSYAIGMLASQAEALNVETISDLRAHPELRFGFTNEFMDRSDGWPSLKAHYQLPQPDVRGLDHDLAYQALANGSIDMTDLYATDAKIQKYDLAILRDDESHFPAYEAVILYRADLERRAPEAVAAVLQLEDAVDAPTMTRLNARVELDGRSETGVASVFLRSELDVDSKTERESSLWRQLLRDTRAHLRLVLVSLAGAIVLAIPLGIWAARIPTHGQAILAGVGIIQTIPSLALLVFLMRPLSGLAEAIPSLRDLGVTGIGNAPAIAALFLYSLLPIVRNTAAGLSQIAPDLKEAAQALGLSPLARLRLVELPLAAPTILAGIKTAVVINIGFATLGALIGAGGYGQPILTGIRLDDYGLILQGAVPAALLAIVAQAWFELLERVIVPRGLRLKTQD